MVPTCYNCPCSDPCPLNYALSLIGGKWKLQIICTLNSSGVLRFNAIRRKLDGISNTVLSKALKELENDGLIKREEFLEIPIRVEYSTTKKCDDLIPILDQLSAWSDNIYKENVNA